MRIGRRSVSIGLVLTAAVGYLGVQWHTSRKQRILRLLREEFGSGIAAEAETDAFAGALAEFIDATGVGDPHRSEIVLLFLRRTNVIRAMETREPVVFLGLGQSVLEAPCQNTLSAGWL